MARPLRNAEPERIAHAPRTFFVTTRTHGGRALLQSTRHAQLLVDVLRACVAARRFQVNDFVVMPNHLHVLLTVQPGTSVEKAVQFVKGGFSYRIKKEIGHTGEVWQRGFSEVRVDAPANLERHREYIRQNPFRAGLVRFGEEYQWCYESLRKQKARGLKPESVCTADGTTKVVP
jgi:putative transposase